MKNEYSLINFLGNHNNQCEKQTLVEHFVKEHAPGKSCTRFHLVCTRFLLIVLLIQTLGLNNTVNFSLTVSVEKFLNSKEEKKLTSKRWKSFLPPTQFGRTCYYQINGFHLEPNFSLYELTLLISVGAQHAHLQAEFDFLSIGNL